MELYNKAIVYYSALSDEKHLEYLQKLQKLFSDEKVQKIMQEGPKAEPTGTAADVSKNIEESNEQEESKNEEEVEGV